MTNIDDPLNGTALYCALCNYLDDVVAGANLVIDGQSLCAEHAAAVINRADYIWWRPDGTFSLTGTIDHHLLSRRANPERSS